MKLSKCAICRLNILRRHDEEHDFYQFIAEKEYDGAEHKKLVYINSDLFINFAKIYNTVKYILHTYPSAKLLQKRTIKTLNNTINFNFVECFHSEHCINLILNNFPKLLIYNYFNGINNVLRGRERRSVAKKSTLYKEAPALFNKYKKN